ncbi:MAG: MoaD/ThiS family protein [Candidatus Thermoplasmatota archaeon]|nr:MoaD/ThiS family protein [Candidatus Thermoplasmatota archaeon]
MENSQTVRSLLMQLEIDPTLVKVALDGTICDLDCEIGNAAEIAILPPVSGG